MHACATHPPDHPLSPDRLRRRPRRRIGLALVIGILLTLLSAVLPATAGPAASGAPVAGEWHRLSPDQDNATPQHERLICDEGQVWRCSYGQVAEPTLEANGNVSRFVGHRVTSRWQCPAWFADDCADVVDVVQGRGHVTLEDGTKFALNEGFIRTESGGREVLWAVVPDFGIAAPWFRTFDEAVIAAGFEPPYQFNGTNWPAQDWISIP